MWRGRRRPPPQIQPSPAPPQAPSAPLACWSAAARRSPRTAAPSRLQQATNTRHPPTTAPPKTAPPPPPPGPAVPGLYQRVKYRSAPPAAMPPAPPRRRTAMTDGSERRNPIGTVPSPVVPGPRREEGRKARLCFFSSRTRPWVLPTVRKLNLEIKEATDPNPHHSKKQRLVQCFIFSSTQQYSNSYSDPVDAPKKRYF